MVSVFALHGCFSVQPYPHKAQAGDTITLSAGAAEGMTPDNTLVHYYPSQSSEQPIELTGYIQSIFNLYPDNKSYAWTDVSTTATQGAYVTMIIVDLPNSMPVGSGFIKIQTDAVYQPPVSVEEIEIAFEILPGEGGPNPLLYYQETEDGVADLSRLMPQPRIDVKAVQDETQWPEYAAVEVTLYAPTREKLNFSTVPDEDIRVVTEQSIRAKRPHHMIDWQRNGDIITAYLINATGQMHYSDIDFSIVLSKDDNEFYDTPSLSSIRYFDLAGNEVTGPLPTVLLNN